MLKGVKIVFAFSMLALTTFMLGGRGAKAAPTGQSALPAEVMQTEWVLRYFDGNARTAQDVVAAGISVKFEVDGTLAGFAGCNNYFGSYSVSGQQLTIGNNLGTTRMACPQAQMLLESRYLKLLPTVKSYTATTRELQLVYGDNGSALVYIPRANTPQVEPVDATVAGMPSTGEGTITLLVLLTMAGSVVAMGLGIILRRDRAVQEARKRK